MTPETAKLIGKELQLELSSEENAQYFHGESMLPFLREGDLVIIRPIAWKDIKRGDVIAYRNKDKFPTRRVYRKRGDQLKMRCDNWENYRDQVSADRVLGRAEARCRDGKWIDLESIEWRDAKQDFLKRAFLRKWKRKLHRHLGFSKRLIP